MIALPLTVWSQTKEVFEIGGGDSIITPQIDGTKALIDELADKRHEIEMLKRNNKSLQDNFAKREIALNDTIDSLKVVIKERTASMAVWRNKHDKVSDSIRSIEANVSWMDSIIFKQCLLYPQERRYNENLIRESLHSLKELGILTNPKYREYCDVYIELLNNYGQYNQELIDFLQQKHVSFSMKKWNINSSVATSAKMDLNGWDYYKLYAKRNDKPFKSIPYLDEVIDQFLEMMNDPQSINQKSYEQLIEKLKPVVKK